MDVHLAVTLDAIIYHLLVSPEKEMGLLEVGNKIIFLLSHNSISSSTDSNQVGGVAILHYCCSYNYPDLETEKESTTFVYLKSASTWITWSFRCYSFVKRVEPAGQLAAAAATTMGIIEGMKFDNIDAIVLDMETNHTHLFHWREIEQVKASSSSNHSCDHMIHHVFLNCFWGRQWLLFLKTASSECQIQ